MIKCALHLKYNIKTKVLKIKNTNAMIFTSLKRIKIVPIKNTKATILTSSKRKENNSPKTHTCRMRINRLATQPNLAQYLFSGITAALKWLFCNLRLIYVYLQVRSVATHRKSGCTALVFSNLRLITVITVLLPELKESTKNRLS